MQRDDTHKYSKGKRPGFRKNSNRSTKPIPEITFETSASKFRMLESSIDAGPFTVFDLETTGGNPEKNAITEIAALKFENGKVVDSFYSLVNPEMLIPPIVRRMTGLNNKMLKDEPTIDKVMPGFVEFVGESVLVSHNTIGDIKFLRHFSEKTTGTAISNFYICTHLLVEKLLPEAPNKSLRGLAEYLRFKTRQFHRAKDDAEATLELFEILIDKLKSKSCNTMDSAIRLQGDYESGMRLGWSVDNAKINALPQDPGVFFLHDRRGKVIFFSSALNLKREVKKLQRFTQLPRPLLKLVLNSYDLSFETAKHHLDAVLREASLVDSEKVTFNATNWHQRTIQCIYVALQDKKLRVGVGPVVAGTIAAFGPINDRKEARVILAKLGRAFGGSEDGDLAFSTDYLKPLLAFFWHDLPSYLQQMEKKSQTLPYKIIGYLRKRLERQQQFARQLQALGAMPELDPLLDLAGTIMLYTKAGAATDVLVVHDATIHKRLTINEPFAKIKETPPLCQKLAKQVRKYGPKPIALKGHGSSAAHAANAILWWIYAHINRKDGVFLTADELEQPKV